MPASAEKLADLLNLGFGAQGLQWNSIGIPGGVSEVKQPQVLFSKLEEAYIDQLRDRYSGSQKDRAVRAEQERQSAAEAPSAEPAFRPAPSAAPAPAATAATAAPVPAAAQEPAAPPKTIPLEGLPVEERFSRLVALTVAKIQKIEKHPKADKLYIETLDDGSGNERVIVSGLVPFYREEELLGKNIILVDNLKPAKLRGTESRGMLLAAARVGAEGKEAVEVLTAPWAAPGDPVVLEGTGAGAARNGELIDVDTFFSIPLHADKGFAFVGGTRLVAGETPLTLLDVTDGEIG